MWDDCRIHRLLVFVIHLETVVPESPTYLKIQL